MKKLLFFMLFPLTVFAQSNVKSEIIGKWQMISGLSICDGKEINWKLYHSVYTFNSDGSYSHEVHQGENNDTSITSGKYKWIGNRINFYSNNYKLNRQVDPNVRIGDGLILDVNFQKGELHLSDNRKELDGCPYSNIFSRIKK